MKKKKKDAASERRGKNVALVADDFL